MDLSKFKNLNKMFIISGIYGNLSIFLFHLDLELPYLKKKLFTYHIIILEKLDFWLDILGYCVRLMSNKENSYHNTNSNKRFVFLF